MAASRTVGANTTNQLLLYNTTTSATCPPRCEMKGEAICRVFGFELEGFGMQLFRNSHQLCQQLLTSCQNF
jgi:hypothetical protein